MEEGIYKVSYLGADEDGAIVKSIEVIASSENEAIQKVVEVRNCADVYGVGEIRDFYRA